MHQLKTGPSATVITGPVPQTRPPHTIRIVGMARSGNHAIINWILNQIDKRWVFLNCVEPKSNPFETARPLDDGRAVLASDPVLPAAGERFMRDGSDCLLFSQEDTFLTPALGEEASRMQGVSEAGTDIIVLRDPYNLMASRMRFGWRPVTPSTERRIWKQHARRVLSARGFCGRRLLPVLYNNWIASKDYRREIAMAMGLRFSDRGWDRMAACGGGSSFQGYAPSPNGVRERWRSFAHDPDYRQMIDGEMAELAEEIFGVDNPLN